ncbi:MAG: GspE/PulE family protein [Pirellulales bacterium]|nr:GspE/PulE family protein [Pirellulales bacterium]
MNSTAELKSQHPLLVQLLLSKEVLSPEKLKTLGDARSKSNAPLESILVKEGLATDKQIAEAYSEYLMMPLYEPSDDKLDPQLASLLPEKLCRDHLLVPVAVHDDELDVAFATFDDLLMADELQLLTGMTIRSLIAPLTLVEKLLDAMFLSGSASFISHVEEYPAEAEGTGREEQLDDSLLELDQAPPPGPDGRVIRMVNRILEQALRVGASDIHIEPFEDSCAIRLRVDGTLRELPPPSRSLFVPIISRFKILAKMDIAEKRVPQDGAIALRGGGKRVDLRVSTVPTVYGEKMVMRILDKGAIPIELTGLGFDERQSKDLIESIQMPHGLMLVTGPTGSGKSTTLYACLNLLNKPDTNICTVEDPVEYKFKGMNQVQVKTIVGLTFASALRAFLRQDPDVVMVGEVRDQETAQICLRAALTGHFVLSTIHTNDSLSAVNRLVDMGIEPFLLASTLRVLEAQRLIRRLCKECREAYDCDPETAKQYGLEAGQTLYRPTGCDHCRGVGYRGRVGVFEVVRITSRMSNLIQTKAPLPELRATAREEGMKLLLDSGLDKVRDGIASLEDVLTVATGDEE